MSDWACKRARNAFNDLDALYDLATNLRKCLRTQQHNNVIGPGNVVGANYHRQRADSRQHLAYLSDLCLD